MTNYSEEIAGLLETVSDPIRMRIIFLIGCRDKLNVTEISGQFSISRPAISHHLKILRNKGVLDCQKVGKEMLYSLNKQRLVKQLRALADELEALQLYQQKEIG